MKKHGEEKFRGDATKEAGGSEDLHNIAAGLDLNLPEDFDEVFDVEENIKEIYPDKQHVESDYFRYEEGEGNADTTDPQRDVADTGDHGIGGENGGQGVDDSNLPEVEIEEDEE